MSKTNHGLVEYARAQVGLPYWYGTYGAIASKSVYDAKKKQYPTHYTANDFASQYGKRVHDCVGLIKGYLWSDTPTSPPKYTKSQDRSASGMYTVCVEKGSIATMPDLVGILVFKSGHVGVYEGNGQVIEAKGHAVGVVRTELATGKWLNWGKCPYIEYDETSPEKTVPDTPETAEPPEITPKPEPAVPEPPPVEAKPIFTRQLSRGIYGDDVWTLKTLLFAGGWYEPHIKITTKGYGSDTVKAVQSFQQAKGLKVDGITGKQTVEAIGGIWEGK